MMFVMQRALYKLVHYMITLIFILSFNIEIVFTAYASINIQKTIQFLITKKKTNKQNQFFFN